MDLGSRACKLLGLGFCWQLAVNLPSLPCEPFQNWLPDKLNEHSCVFSAVVCSLFNKASHFLKLVELLVKGSQSHIIFSFGLMSRVIRMMQSVGSSLRSFESLQMLS